MEFGKDDKCSILSLINTHRLFSQLKPDADIGTITHLTLALVPGDHAKLISAMKAHAEHNINEAGIAFGEGQANYFSQFGPQAAAYIVELRQGGFIAERNYQ
jgi:hypothetical protein